MKPVKCPVCGGAKDEPITRAELLATLTDGTPAPSRPCHFCRAGTVALYIHRGKYYTEAYAMQWLEQRKERKT